MINQIKLNQSSNINLILINLDSFNIINYLNTLINNF